jgi:CMP-N-acetylneuraminic acid synthetase
LGGHPLLHYAIQAARASRDLERIVVDTEDEEIARVARAEGAEAPYARPLALAGDSTPTMPVLRHALCWFDEHEGFLPDAILLLEPTRPFVRADQIDRSVQTLRERPDADSLCSVIEVPNRFHPSRIRKVDEAGWLQFIAPDDRALYPNRQSLPVRYTIGNLWLFRPIVVQTKEIPIGDRCLWMPVDELSCFDIDRPEDLRVAEALLPLVRDTES